MFKEFKINVSTNDVSAYNMIEAGVVLEDAIYHNAHILGSETAKAGDGRFNNHFYSAQKEIFNDAYSVLDTPYSITIKTLNNLRQTNRASFAEAPIDAWGTRTDNISWALEKDVSVGQGRKNLYTIHEAFEYYKKSFDGIKKDRKKYQAKLFASMGFLIHLIQDLHSPAHVRNGAHAGGDYLEIYGRYYGGFFLSNGRFEGGFDSTIFSAIANINIKEVILTNNQYSSYQDFFTKEANWVSKNFFSEAHEKSFYGEKLISNGEGLEFDDDTCFDKTTTIFDSKFNLTPTKTNTGLAAIPGAETFLNGSYDKWFYITNPLANTAVTGGDTVGIKEKGYFWDCHSMAAVTDGVSSNKSYSNYNKKALHDTAVNVMPRAVAASQAFINYFFRARMEAYINYEDANGARILDTITIKNVSDPSLVSSEELLTFKAGTKFTVSYRTGEDENEIISELKTGTLPDDLLVDEEFELEGLKELFATADVDIQNGDKVLVLLDGQVGEKQGLNEYSIDARGLAVAYATEPKILIKRTGAVSINSFDDGYYQKGVTPGYAPFSDADLVYDRVTKLYWHDPAEIPKLTFQEATDYCNNLNYLDSQWRLPKTREVLSLYDVKLFSSPIFKDDRRRLRTNRSTYVDSIGYQTSVSTLHISGVSSVDDESEIYTRCVVGIGVGLELVESTLVRDDSKAIVRDRSTGLIWQDNIEFDNNSTPRTYEENLNYCESLTLGGYNDWRMPNENELFSLVGEGALDSGVLAPFQTNNTASFFAVSSTPKADISRSMVSVVSGHAQRALLERILNCYGCGYAEPWEGYTRCVR